MKRGKIFQKIKSHWPAFCLVAAYAAIFALLSIGRHAALKSYLNDLGNFDQAIWNTAHGAPFAVTANMLNIKNYLSNHFSPILAVFAPFYLAASTPKWLLVFQAVAAGASAIPIYFFAQKKLESTGLGLVFLIGYLLYPFLHNGLLYDFHEVVFATAFASCAFFFLEKGKDKLFILFAVLLALSQEHLPLLVFMMGLYLAFVKKRRKFGLAVSAVSLGYFLLVIFALMPHFSETGQPSLLAPDSADGSRYGWLGYSIPDIAGNIAAHPLAVAKIIFSAERMTYLFLLVAPVFSLAFFSWPILMILPLILINLLSSNSMTYSIFFYHSAIFAPFVFFAAIFTYKRWFRENAFLKNSFAVLILFSSLAASLAYSVTPLSKYYLLGDYIPSDHAKIIRKIQDIIPADASLSVQHNLGPHFSERRFVYRFPIKKDEAQYILLDTVDPYAENGQQLFLFPYALQMEVGEWKQEIENLKKSEKFSLIFDQNGYLLFKSITQPQ